MIGPLPTLYRLLLLASSILLGGVLGVIAGATPKVPVMMSTGLLLGAAAGAVLYLLMTHQRPTGRR